VRVIDETGYPITVTQSLGFKGTATAGGGTVTLSPSVFIPNIRIIQFRLGPNAGANTYQIGFGDITPVTVTIAGTGATP